MTFAAVLEGLTRTRLLEVAKDLKITGLSAKPKTEVITRLSQRQTIELEAVLALLKRDELKAVCRTLGIDDKGRKKAILVERLLGAEKGAYKDGSVIGGEAERTITNKGQEGQMAKPGKGTRKENDRVGDYRHEEATRKNNPEVGLANWEPVQKRPPRVTYEYDPFLDPQLQWAGKAERLSFDVDTVSLHIHERVSTQAVIDTVKKNGQKDREQQLYLFGDPQLPLDKAVEFYQHDVEWVNRLMLGDSLLVMNSLLQRELMAGSVQMIYLDPPYGVSYNSNFQPSTSRREVKDGQDGSLTREPEQIKAYRDTWKLGIHSYLTYLRDRLLLCRELLAETGSIFVQISDENLHHVRELLDEVYGPENFISIIPFVTTSSQTRALLPTVCDFILWYAKEKERVKYRQLYLEKELGGRGGTKYNKALLSDGKKIPLNEALENYEWKLPENSRVYRIDTLTSQSGGENSAFPVEFEGEVVRPRRGFWKTNQAGMKRLIKSERVAREGASIGYIRFLDDFRVFPFGNVWTDYASIQSRSDPKVYVVQTATKVIQRCLLMTTDPGDLVFDPTCGSGTTAYVAEQWGRRWITCDTSRVALALARQRLLTATYPYYQLAHPEQGVDAGFVYETVPHITLKSIAQNTKIDEVAEDAPKRREKIDKIIREGAEQETLYDKPLMERGRVRVSGPFSVESIPVPTIEDPASSPIDQWETLDPDARKDDISRRGRGSGIENESTNFILDMIDALKKAGINRMGGGTIRFTKLNAVRSAGVIQAEGELEGKGGDSGRHVGVSFGPRYGPVTIRQVEYAVNEARGRYDGAVIAGFTFAAPAQEFLKRDLPVEVMGAYVNPDVLVGDLLKTSKASQIFTLFGQADIKISAEEEGHRVEVRGVDLYDPQTGEVHSDQGREIAAWFVDTDYDERCFNICQAFFPGGGKNPWQRIARALRGKVDEAAFEDLRRLRSIPFQPGKKIAVKVIDHRGNEMLEVFDVSKEAEEI